MRRTLTKIIDWVADLLPSYDDDDDDTDNADDYSDIDRRRNARGVFSLLYNTETDNDEDNDNEQQSAIDRHRLLHTPSAQLDAALNGNLEPVLDSINATLFKGSSTDFDSEHGLNEASFKFLFIHHFMSLLRFSTHHDHRTFELDSELYVRHSDRSSHGASSTIYGKYGQHEPKTAGFIDLWLSDKSTGRSLLIEFKYARISYLLDQGGRPIVLPSGSKDRKALSAGCQRLSDLERYSAETVQQKEFGGSVRSIKTIMHDAYQQAYTYALIMRNDKQRQLSGRVTVAAVVGYGNRIAYESQSFNAHTIV